MATILEHEGSKYLCWVFSADSKYETKGCWIDIYSIIEGYKVTCPARAQAIKKLLCAGARGKGTVMDDLKGALAAINRAIEIQSNRERSLPDA